MSVENVKKFYEAVSKDELLKQKFVELSQKYQGQPMDEEKAMSVMEQEGLPMAEQMGYSFSLDDLKVYGEEMKQANMNRELSDEEMQAVVGGSGTESGFCILIGFMHSTWTCSLSSINGSEDYWLPGFCVGPGTSIVQDQAKVFNGSTKPVIMTGFFVGKAFDVG